LRGYFPRKYTKEFEIKVHSPEYLIEGEPFAIGSAGLVLGEEADTDTPPQEHQQGDITTSLEEEIVEDSNNMGDHSSTDSIQEVPTDDSTQEIPEDTITDQLPLFDSHTTTEELQTNDFTAEQVLYENPDENPGEESGSLKPDIDDIQFDDLIAADNDRQSEVYNTVTEVFDESDMVTPEIPTESLQDTNTPETPEADSRFTGRRVSWQQDDADSNEGDMDTTEGASMFNNTQEWLDAYLNMLPVSVRKVIDQEPFGLPPHVAVISGLLSALLLVLTLLCTCCKSKPHHIISPVQLANVAELEEKIFILMREKEANEHMLSRSKRQVEDLSEHVSDSGRGAKDLQQQLNTVKLHNAALQRNENACKDKISELTEELQQQRTLLAEGDNQNQEKDGQICDLQYRLTQTANQLDVLDSQHLQVQGELQASDAALHELDSQSTMMKEEVSFLQQSKDQLLLEVAGWQDRLTDLQHTNTQLTDQHTQQQETITFKNTEIEVLKDCLLQLKSLGGDVTADADDQDQTDDAVSEEKRQEKITAMMDVSMCKAEMQQTAQECQALKTKLQIEIEGRKQLEEECSRLREESDHLRRGHTEAEQQSHEATTKLSVLATYFEKKEVQLQKELGQQEILRKANQNLAGSAEDQRKTMEEEMSTYRVQVEDLKKEIEKVERDFRSQISTNEKKAHENWLAARQAERDLKESKNEAAVLRQRLFEVEQRAQHNGPGILHPIATRPGGPPHLNGPLPPGPPRPHSRDGMIPPPSHIRERDSPMYGDRPRGGMPPPPHILDRLPPDARSPHSSDRYRPGEMRSPPPPMRSGPPPDMRSAPPPDMRSGPPPDMRDLPPFRRTPPSFEHANSPPPMGRSPPPFDSRSPGPYDRRTPPHLRRPSDGPGFGRGPPRGPPPPDYRGAPPPHTRGPPGPPLRHRTSSPNEDLYPPPRHTQRP